MPSATPATMTIAEVDAPARFTLPKGILTTLVPSSKAHGLGPGAAVLDQEETYGEGQVTVPARLLSSMSASYPPAARQAEIGGCKASRGHCHAAEQNEAGNQFWRGVGGMRR